jgi:hypothetical protein
MDFDRRLLRRGEIVKVSRRGPERYILLLLSDLLLTATEAVGKGLKLHQWIELRHPASAVSDLTAEGAAALGGALQGLDAGGGGADGRLAFQVL